MATTGVDFQRKGNVGVSVWVSFWVQNHLYHHQYKQDWLEQEARNHIHLYHHRYLYHHLLEQEEAFAMEINV